MWQDDRSHYMLNLETKEALKNIWCDYSLFTAQIKRKLSDARCWFLWQIQELPGEEFHPLTVRLRALVLFKLFLVEQDARLNKIKNSLKLRLHFLRDYKQSSFDLEELQANVLGVWKCSTGLCVDTGTLSQRLTLLTTDAHTSAWYL